MMINSDDCGGDWASMHAGPHPELAVDGRPRHALEPLELPRRGAVAPLHLPERPPQNGHQQQHARHRSAHDAPRRKHEADLAEEVAGVVVQRLVDNLQGERKNNLDDWTGNILIIERKVKTGMR